VAGLGFGDGAVVLAAIGFDGLDGGGKPDGVGGVVAGDGAAVVVSSAGGGVAVEGDVGAGGGGADDGEAAGMVDSGVLVEKLEKDCPFFKFQVAEVAEKSPSLFKFLFKFLQVRLKNNRNFTEIDVNYVPFWSEHHLIFTTPNAQKINPPR
jgi:hypothetical protein